MLSNRGRVTLAIDKLPALAKSGPGRFSSCKIIKACQDYIASVTLQTKVIRTADLHRANIANQVGIELG